MSNFSKIQKQLQANQLQEQLAKMKEQIKAQTFTGSSGNGLVTLVINGEKQLQSIKIKPECVDPEDVEGLEDLIKAAFNDAFTQANEDSSMELPGGFSFPF